MTLKYKVGDVVVLADNVEQNWRKTFVPGVAVKIDEKFENQTCNDHYTVTLKSDPSDFWYIDDSEINHEATALLQMSNQSGYLVQKISVEIDVVSCAVNESTPNNTEEKKMEFKLGDKVKYIGTGWDDSFSRDVVYPVTEVWVSGGGCDIDETPVSSRFYSDFELVEEHQLKAQDNSWYESGELSPIGANIEYKLGAGPWYEATVKYVLDVLDGDEDEIVIACPHLGFEQLLTLNKHTKIRPALSPEEIAQQDREKAIADVEGAICNQMGSLNVRELAEYLVDKYNFRVEE